MNTRLARRAGTTLALVLVTAFGCRTADPQQVRNEAQAELRTYVRQHVADAARRDAALALLDQLDEELKALRTTTEAFRAELAELSPRHETTSEQLLEAYEAHAKRRDEVRARLVDLHFKLRETLTDEEWPGYVERELALFEVHRPRPRPAASEDEEG
jgi:hypothetical protein